MSPAVSRIQPTKAEIAARLSNALREHVFNEMPIRMLKLPEMVLVERGAVLQHLLRRLAYITQRRFDEMIEDTIQWRKLHAEEDTSQRRREIEMRRQNMEGLTRRHPLSTFSLAVGSDDIDYEDIEKAKQVLVAKFIDEHAIYAILSHTWLEDYPEVTYRDRMEEKTWATIVAEQQPAYQKLFWFCKTAYEAERVDLAWMDTVCINKDSTTELEESIRSMFRWYQSAKICYCYLADTESLKDMDADRWFTRGWTLQELLAPRKIKFYNKNWMPLSNEQNDKRCSDITSIIERVTTISVVSISSFEPRSDRGVAHKMAWAAKRRTTKAEDHAYCLMGIFGVSFSIAYGEGPERAFLRLIEAILTTYPNCYDVFNFAGEPIDIEIHASNIIPSSPLCYLAHKHDLKLDHLYPRRPLTLTHIGMRIPLLIVTAKYDATYASAHDESEHRFHCADIYKWTAEPVMCNPIDPLNTEHFGFAIWNFSELPGDKFLIPSMCAIFLLDLDVDETRAGREGWSRYIAMDSIDYGSKIDTEEVLTMQISGLDGPVERQRLGEYGITYASVYL